MPDLAGAGLVALFFPWPRRRVGSLLQEAAIATPINTESKAEDDSQLRVIESPAAIPAGYKGD